MPTPRYLHYDVFTSRPFEGNQLAVFLDARGLSRDDMQTLTNEMNFAESTFVLPAETAGHRHPHAHLHAGARDADGRASHHRHHLRARRTRRHRRAAARAGCSV